MTKKDYELIADTLYFSSKELQNLFTKDEVTVIVNIYEDNFKRSLKKENERFDTYKFDNAIRGLK